MESVCRSGIHSRESRNSRSGYWDLGGQDEIIRQRGHVAWVAYDSAKLNGEIAIGAVVSDAIPPNQELFKQSLEVFQDTKVTVVPFREAQKLHALLEQAKAV